MLLTQSVQLAHKLQHEWIAGQGWGAVTCWDHHVCKTGAQRCKHACNI